MKKIKIMFGKIIPWILIIIPIIIAILVFKNFVTVEGFTDGFKPEILKSYAKIKYWIFYIVLFLIETSMEVKFKKELDEDDHNRVILSLLLSIFIMPIILVLASNVVTIGIALIAFVIFCSIKFCEEK
jgi:hypothetical protein